jgi:hypothetical protein
MCGTAAPVRAPDALALAQRFLRAAFPELVGQRLTTEFHLRSGIDGPFLLPPLTVRVFDSRDPPPAGVSENRNDQLLGSSMWMVSGHMDDALFFGRHVHSNEIDALTKTCAQHPDWKLSDVGLALSELNAKYGPDAKDAFLRTAPTGRFAAVLGPIQRVQVTFNWQSRDDAGRLVEYPPGWGVSFEARAPGRPRVCYSATFEPLDGRLARLHSESCESDRPVSK